MFLIVSFVFQFFVEGLEAVDLRMSKLCIIYLYLHLH